MRIIKEETPLGATIREIDLRHELSRKEKELIAQALAEHQVLFFRDQPISPQQHKSFALNFGSLQTHPAYPTVEGFPEITILENDRKNPSKIEEWHTDMTFRSSPPLGSILLAKIIPKSGGDTLFSSLSAAYEGLDKEIQESLTNLTATHSFEYGFKESLEEPGGKERLKQALLDNPPVNHPVVRTHPITGRKLIYVNKLFTCRINELNEKESSKLLNFLFAEIQNEEYVCRFKWEKNSIVFWDNRSILHRPDNDYWPEIRRMERITIDDCERPY